MWGDAAERTPAAVVDQQSLLENQNRLEELHISYDGEERLNESFIVLTIGASLIASLGLVADNNAVIIGAMVVAPWILPLRVAVADAEEVLRYGERREARGEGGAHREEALGQRRDEVVLGADVLHADVLLHHRLQVPAAVSRLSRASLSCECLGNFSCVVTGRIACWCVGAPAGALCVLSFDW